MMQRRIGSMLGTMALCAACSQPPVMPADTGVPTDSGVASDAMTSGEGGACNEFGAIVTPSRNMDMNCEGFQAAPCNMADPEFCPRFRNNEPMRRKFVLTQIDIQTPASLLATQPVGRLLNTSIRNAAFSWGIDLDLGMMRIRTGTIRQPVNRVFGTGYFAQDMQFVMGGAPGMGADRWNPISAPITSAGGLIGMPMGMTVPLITIPVYDENDRTMLLTELPLRDARIGELRLTANGNCIGTAKPNFDSCAANTTRWNTSSGDAPMVTPYGVLEAKLTFEDTLSVQVVSLNMPLCNIIARSPCRDSATMMPVNPMSLTIPPDTTVMVGGMAKPAWTLRAFIAGAAVNITN